MRRLNKNNNGGGMAAQSQSAPSKRRQVSARALPDGDNALDVQKTGFSNGKICWTTPGLKLDPHLPREKFLDPRMIMHQSFVSMPPPPNLGRWLGMVEPRCRPITVCLPLQCRGFNIGTVISVILFFLY